MTTATGILRCHSYPLATPEFRCIKQRRLPQRALCCRQQSHAKHDDQGSPALESIPLTSCRCCVGGRRNLLLGAPLSAGSMPALRACSSDGDVDSTVSSDAKLVRPSRPRWYRELYAWSMTRTMDSYEEKVAESLPVRDNSMDAVVGTLVLCSVDDVDMALMGR